MKHNYDAVVVGAGYVGLTLAIHMANRGLSVLSFDIDESKIRALQEGGNSIYEQGIEKALQQAIRSGNLSFSNSPPSNGATVWIIAASYIPGKPENYIECFRNVRGDNGQPPLIAIRTTIPVGLTRGMIIPALEKTLHGRFDEDFFVSVCPERTLSGAAIEELSNLPQLVGGTSISIEKTKILFERAGIRCIPLQSFEAAELAKTFTNFYRFSQFNLANFFGACCHRFGISEELLRKNLSDGYERFDLKSTGPGVGGFCLPKDSLVLSDGLNFGGTDTQTKLFDFPKDQYELNDRVMRYFQEAVLTALQGTNRILALGIAFKGSPPTDDIRGSVGIQMVEYLMNAGKEVHVYDACVPREKIRGLGFRPFSSDVSSDDFGAYLLLNNHEQNAKLVMTAAKNRPHRSIILYDPWRLLVSERDPILIRNFNLKNLLT